MDHWLGRVLSWPFTYGYSLVKGSDNKETEQKANNGSSGRKAQRSFAQSDWTLAPVISQAMRNNSNSTEDLALHSSYYHGNAIDENAQSTTNFSIFSCPIPVEEESFPAFLAGMPDTAFPRYRLTLPKQKKILVLDLDETLVHSTSASAVECDFLVEVLVEHMSCLYYVHKRPFVDEFIDAISNWYQLAIYTASLREYADPVINMLDRGRRFFPKRLFRNACIEKDGMYMKDLSMVDTDLSRVFLLDNSTVSFILNPDNGIFIDSWISDKKDTCLLDLLPFLDALRFVEDVRSILSLRAFG